MRHVDGTTTYPNKHYWSNYFSIIGDNPEDYWRYENSDIGFWSDPNYDTALDILELYNYNDLGGNSYSRSFTPWPEQVIASHVVSGDDGEQDYNTILTLFDGNFNGNTILR